MADITSPQAVRFSNAKARVLADMIESTRRTAEQFAIDVVTEFENHTSGKVNSDVVIDGAETDGRQIVTKGGIAGLKYVAEQLVTCLTTDDRESLVAAVSVNGTPRF